MVCSCTQLVKISRLNRRRLTPSMQWYFLGRSVCSSLIVLIGVHPAVATSSRVVLVAVLVAHLATRFSSPVLPAFGETLVQIGTDDALVEFCAADVFHAVERVLVCVVFNEAEAAGRLLESIKAHDEAFDLAAP